MILSLNIFHSFFNLHPLCLNTTRLLVHIPKWGMAAISTRPVSLPLPVYTGKHIQEWLLLESLPSHSSATLKWTFSHSFICCSILGLEFRFHFKTSTIPYLPSKGIKCRKHLVQSGTMQPPEFYCLPNTDDHTGHEIPALLFLAESLINSMTKISTPNLSHHASWTLRFPPPPPQYNCGRKVLFRHFFQRAGFRRIFLCLRVCTTVKSYTVLFFHLLMRISNIRTTILLEMRLHSFENTLRNYNRPPRNI